MDLNDFFGPKPEPIDLQAKDRWEAIDELVAHLATAGKIKHEHTDAIAAAIKKRETSMSTGVGFGIGIPHAATDLVSHTVGAIGRSRKGISFDAMDGNPVHLVALFLVPQGQFQKHLHTLANLAKLSHNPEWRRDLCERWRSEVSQTISGCPLKRIS